MKNKICVYAICKNEEQFVDRWLTSMQEADYIVVLDTGSTDNTYNLLQQDPRVTKVEQKEITPWRFDVARNESLKLVPDDANILVCTDLDEILEPGWAYSLKEKWIDGVHQRAIYKYAWSHAPSGAAGRVFKYDKIHNRDWVWNYPVHECLVHADDLTNADYANYLDVFDDIYLHHYPDDTKSRSSYLPLLLLRKQEYPEDVSGLIYLSHEYYYRGLYENSIQELTHIIEHHRDKLSNFDLASCYLFMGDSYKAMEAYPKAIESYYTAMHYAPDYREPYMDLADTFNQIKLYNQAIATVKDGIKNSTRHYSWLERDDTWSYIPHDILSIAYYWVEEYDLALSHVMQALSYCPNDERILLNKEYIIQKALTTNKGE